MTTNPIIRSLEIAAERCPDLTPLVYPRLFAAHPELETHFVLDTDNSVRGSMLSWVLTTILDIVEGGQIGTNLVETEAMNHDGYGVPPATFNLFFGFVRDAVAEVCGTDWTVDMARAWQDVVDRLQRIAVPA